MSEEIKELQGDPFYHLSVRGVYGKYLDEIKRLFAQWKRDYVIVDFRPPVYGEKYVCTEDGYDITECLCCDMAIPRLIVVKRPYYAHGKDGEEKKYEEPIRTNMWAGWGRRRYRE